jgi:hypothetical protein
MIWGGINRLEPPYEIRVHATHHCTAAVSAQVSLLAACLKEGRAEFNLRNGHDVRVSLTQHPWVD